MNAMAALNDISVSYNDNAIRRNLIWDTTEIHKTNDIYPGVSLAKFGDVLKELKENVDRNELFPIVDIFRWVYKVNGIKNTLLDFKYKELKTTYQLRHFLRKMYVSKKKGLNVKLIKKKQVYRKGNLRSISLADWEHNRKIFIDILENKKLRGKIVNRHYYRYYSTKGNWWWCLDYFFTHIKEYKTDKKLFEMEWNIKMDILNTPPRYNDKLYLITRILKNTKNWQHIKATLNGYYCTTINKDTKLLETSQLGNIKLLFKHNNCFYLNKYEMVVLSYRQIEAVVWLLRNLNNVSKRPIEHSSMLLNALRLLEDFLKRTKYYEQRYDCVYVEGKKYRSLWL